MQSTHSIYSIVLYIKFDIVATFGYMNGLSDTFWAASWARHTVEFMKSSAQLTSSAAQDKTGQLSHTQQKRSLMLNEYE